MAKGITEPKTLSEALAKIVGEPKMSRGEIMKKVWVYIKAEGLQKNPNDKREIHPDEKLATVLGDKPINMFAMVKKINEHIVD